MEGDRTFSGNERVVILSREGSLAESLGENFACASVTTPYEAAAELLTAPTVALVIDLRLLATRHVGLLDVARSLAVEILAIGSLHTSMSADDLNQVRLIARVDLPAALVTIARAGASEEQVGDSEAFEESAQQDSDALAAVNPSEPTGAPNVGNYEAEKPPRQGGGGRRAAATRDILSSEEIAALLGDK